MIWINLEDKLPTDSDINGWEPWSQEKWEKWKEKQMWRVNVDEGVWVKDEKEREKMIQEIKQSEKEYEEFWYDPFCQSDCDDCEFD